MKKITKQSFLLFFLLLGPHPTMVNAQEVKEVLNKVTDFYKNAEQYRVQMKFSMLRGIKGNKVTESYTAVMERNGNYTKNSILDTEVFVFPKGQVVVDQTKKKVTYSNKTNFSKLSTTFDMGDFLKYYEKSQLLDTGNQWICEMVSTNGNFSQLPYSKIELHINKNDHSIAKQVFYFANLVPFHEENGKSTVQDYARMVIDLEHDFNSKVEKRTLSDFVTVLSSENIQLHKDYSGYQLALDTTYN